VVEILDAVVELASVGDAGEVDVLTRNCSSSCFALRNITIILGGTAAQKNLKRFALFVKSIAFDVVNIFEFASKGNQFLGDHWDELSGILPVADVIVDLVEESLAANLEVLQVAETIVAGTVATVGGNVVRLLIPGAVGGWLENWRFVRLAWTGSVVVATVLSGLGWLRWVRRIVLSRLGWLWWVGWIVLGWLGRLWWVGRIVLSWLGGLWRIWRVVWSVWCWWSRC